MNVFWNLLGTRAGDRLKDGSRPWWKQFYTLVYGLVSW
jgi:hypothetical protein